MALDNIDYAPLLKLDRAKKHLNELKDCIARFSETEFYSISPHVKADTGQPIVRVTVQPLPKDIPLMIGDVVHNLRSALDILWNTMILRITGIESETGFPIRQKWEELNGTIGAANEVVTPAVPTIKNILLNDIKAYKDGNPAIWYLNRLNRSDKHRLLIASVNITPFRHITAQDKGHNTVMYTDVCFRPGTSEFHGGVYELKDVSHSKPGIAVLFDDELLKGRDVLRSLQEMGYQTQRAIELIAAAWRASGRT
jgi:hypothetical protein